MGNLPVALKQTQKPHQKKIKNPLLISICALLSLLLVVFFFFFDKPTNQVFLDPDVAWKELQEGKPRTFERVSATTMHPSAEVRRWVNDNITTKRYPRGGIRWSSFENFKGGILFFGQTRPPQEVFQNLICGNFRFNTANIGFIWSVYHMDLDSASPGKDAGDICFDTNMKKISIDLWKDAGPAIQRQAVIKKYFSQHPYFRDWGISFIRR